MLLRLFQISIKIKRWYACALEANRVSLGIPSLKDYENVGSTCKLPAQLIYGPITSRRAALHTVWFMSSNGSIRLTHRHLKCHTGYVADYEENRCSDGSGAQVVWLHIQLDFSNPNVVEFAGAFVTEGTHFVIAALESYAWEQLAPPKLIKLPIRVIPPQMKAAAVLNPTESPIATTGGQLSRRGTDLGRIVGFRFAFLGG
ncbi:hypothetical protein EmuJ_000723200 [Echinococcus multilocularis]|uniref:Uncharacterized protein n=1 Tax=Echinococcus multilocularis TaxID=6211 RepID=A0A068YBJ8_ECHMU|nr:hypothetical protein EmuJ_000723200 [Echinococcus multilocularis]